jgi:hypothetical protein
MSFPTPVPLVLLGQRVEVGKPVSESLRPEYEGRTKRVMVGLKTR